ncbi:MAG: hypothetical protein HQL72_11815 [Magnetococcales bacterium]|nr:hypothetical protein [Magnetococcales bacterium]
MISANIVAQVMTVSQVTYRSQVGSEHASAVDGGCPCDKKNDFMAILDEMAARQPDGLSANSPFFPGMGQGGSFLDRSSEENIHLFASMLSGDKKVGSQDPFNFIQSLNSSQKSTFQSIEYGLASSAGSQMIFEEAKALFQQVSDSFFNRDNGLGSNTQPNQWDFPPAGAPEKVMKAWDQASSEASEMDKMLVSGLFFGSLMAEGQPSDQKGEEGTSQALYSLTLDQYWQQVETLMALIDRSVQREPQRESDTNGAKDLLGRFLEELEKVSGTEEA